MLELPARKDLPLHGGHLCPLFPQVWTWSCDVAGQVPAAVCLSAPPVVASSSFHQNISSSKHHVLIIHIIFVRDRSILGNQGENETPREGHFFYWFKVFILFSGSIPIYTTMASVSTCFIDINSFCDSVKIGIEYWLLNMNTKKDVLFWHL